MNPSDAIGQVERVQVLIEKGPLAFTSALFAFSALFLLLIHLRYIARRRAEDLALERAHAAAVAELQEKRLQTALAINAAIQQLLELNASLRAIALDAERRNKRWKEEGHAPPRAPKALTPVE